MIQTGIYIAAVTKNIITFTINSILTSKGQDSALCEFRRSFHVMLNSRESSMTSKGEDQGTQGQQVVSNSKIGHLFGLLAGTQIVGSSYSNQYNSYGSSKHGQNNGGPKVLRGFEEGNRQEGYSHGQDYITVTDFNMEEGLDKVVDTLG